MSVQSCASVPPAPEFTVTDRVALVVLAGEQRRAAPGCRAAGRALRARSPISSSTDSSLSSRASSASVSRSETVPSSWSTSVTSSWSCDELGVDLAGAVLVVPEVGLARPRPRAPRSGSRASSILQVAARALDAAAQLGEVVGEITHGSSGGERQRPWQSLYFLPLPQKHGSLRPGVLSTRPASAFSGSGGSAWRPAVAEVAGELLGRHRRRGGAHGAGALHRILGGAVAHAFGRRRPRRLLHRRDLQVRHVARRTGPGSGPSSPRTCRSPHAATRRAGPSGPSPGG